MVMLFGNVAQNLLIRGVHLHVLHQVKIAIFQPFVLMPWQFWS